MTYLTDAEADVIHIILCAGDVGVSPGFFGTQRMVAESLRRRGIVYWVQGGEEYGSGYAIIPAHVVTAEAFCDRRPVTRQEVAARYYYPSNQPQLEEA